MFKALHFKNFRLFYFGFLFSNTGNMIQTVAISWLAYKITGSTFMVALLFFVKQLMMFLLSPIAGSLADSFKRINILIVTSSVSGVLGTALALLTINGEINSSYLIIYYFFDGFLMGIDMTTRQAFLKDIVRGRMFLSNAIALNSLLFNIARIIGPLLAGYLISIYPKNGEGICFLFNGLSFFALTASLLFMKNVRSIIVPSQSKMFKKIQEGFSYTVKFPRIKNVIILAGIVGLFGFPITVLLPDYCDVILGVEAKELGMLTTTTGVGAVVGGIILASRKNFETYQILISFSPFIYGVAIFSLAFTYNYYYALIAMFFIGLGQSLFFASCNSLIQNLADKNMVGRTVSLYITLFMGATTLGSIFSGKLAHFIGTSNTFLLCGIGCVLTVMAYLFNEYQLKAKAKA